MDLIKQIETEKRYHPIGSPKAPVELLPNGIEVPSTIAHESDEIDQQINTFLNNFEESNLDQVRIQRWASQ